MTDNLMEDMRALAKVCLAGSALVVFGLMLGHVVSAPRQPHKSPVTEPCMTASELADRATFLGQAPSVHDGVLFLSTEREVNVLFTTTVTERWHLIDAGYCRIEAAAEA